jgi:hypothetical protein
MKVGNAVSQLVEALRYKTEGRGFDSRWCHWNFTLIQSFRQHCGPEVDSASNRNEYQEYFLGGKGGRCLRLKILPLSYGSIFLKSESLNLLEPTESSRPVMGLLYLYLYLCQQRKSERNETLTKHLYIPFEFTHLIPSKALWGLT